MPELLRAGAAHWSKTDAGANGQFIFRREFGVTERGITGAEDQQIVADFEKLGR